ncbi:peptide-methionine (S)-S-oxide reductase MsrA [Thalassotalea atypica]|uniref:peptide-methionine (S)-S-oxide reductase MsrA n=1 Tax=Thalassotalea atypica TaxID=2054316 RepID=UPI0025726529|nr:peptide-methionine (S)-S-oxide reductase MsrA [Thalassotalea atypica]
MTQKTQLITLAGGCFWCIEGAFNNVMGVVSTKSGYMGGQAIDATYKHVCTGTTAHAEVVQLSFDPTRITTREILEIFFSLHNPTQLNRQGNDVGPQYRSAVFYHNIEQKQAAEQIITEIEEDKIWPDTVVTEVVESLPFYPAESAHNNYYENNSESQYCQLVISPKLAKLRQTFASKLK